MNGVLERIAEELDQVPAIDAHSHLDAERPQARDIGDILFYHFLRREFYSAGGNDEVLVSGRPLEERVEYFLSKLPMVKNTATYWCVRKILRDLYGLEEDLDGENWKRVNERIAETGGDDSWPEELLAKRLKIRRTFCCVDRLDGGLMERFCRKPSFLPHLEAFSFGPGYLDGLMSFVRGGGPLPENLKAAEERFGELVEGCMETGAKSFGSAVAEDFALMPCSEGSAEEAYRNYSLGKRISADEKNALATRFLCRFLETVGGRGAVQFYLGAGWKFGSRHPDYGYGESYVRVSHQLTGDLAKVFKGFPGVRFNVMFCAESMGQELTIVARMLRNVSLLGFWWHSLFPSYIERAISERVEALPANKWMLLGTDAYNCEWCYGKAKLVKDCLARVLARKVERGHLAIEDAKFLATRILYENAREACGVDL
ncbi:MAG: hypothetical protein JTT11_03725 [Candidatus Brockarchaeota archaeon]|nr:hypothetical protein [Candidatus Brockarchaeota archaeon]